MRTLVLLLGMSFAVADIIIPASVPSNTKTKFTIQTDKVFNNATGLNAVLLDATGSWSTLTPQPTFLVNNGREIEFEVSIPTISANAIVDFQLSGESSPGTDITTRFIPVTIYPSSSQLSLSRTTCGVALCGFTITVSNGFVSDDTTVRLTDEDGTYSFWPTKVMSSSEVFVELVALRVETYTLMVAINGVHYTATTTLKVVDQGPVTVGFVLFGELHDYGWAYSHNVARLALENKYSGRVITKLVSEAPEEGFDYAQGKRNFAPEHPDSIAAEAAFQSLIDQGCDLIFGTSFGYMHTMLKLSAKNPTVKMVHISGYMTTATLSTGFARMYQARYIAGLITGGQMAAKKQSTCVAYPAAFNDIPEVVRQLNAFTHGCVTANKNCVVKSMWLGTWGDDWIEQTAAEYAWNKLGCHYFHHHSDSLLPQKVYKDFGGIGIGFNVDVRANIGDSILTSVMYDWMAVFEHFTRYLLESSEQTGDKWVPNEQYWPGLPENAVSLTAMSPNVDAAVRNLASSETQRLRNGGEVFCGTIYRADGSVQPGSGPGKCLNDGDLLGMKWLIQGVQDDGDFVAPPKPVPKGATIDTAGLISISVGLVVAWIMLVAPLLYITRTKMANFSATTIRAMLTDILCASVLDAMEMSAALMVFSSLEGDLDFLEQLQLVLGSGMLLNIVALDGFTLWRTYKAELDEDVLNLDMLREKHSAATMLLVLPIAVIEVRLYLVSLKLTELICVIVLFIDLGYRIKSLVLFASIGEAVAHEKSKPNFGQSPSDTPPLDNSANDVKTVKSDEATDAKDETIPIDIIRPQHLFFEGTEHKEPPSFAACCAARP